MGITPTGADDPLVELSELSVSGEDLGGTLLKVAELGLDALNLYARRRSAFDEESAVRLGRFSTHAGIVLSNARAYRVSVARGENLARAMDSRATIDIATGILMARSGRSPEAAFQMLVSASQRENRKLRDIAAEIVERTAVRGPDGSEGDGPQFESDRN